MYIAGIAQLVERLTCNQEVESSIPSVSSFYFYVKLESFLFFKIPFFLSLIFVILILSQTINFLSIFITI